MSHWIFLDALEGFSLFFKVTDEGTYLIVSMAVLYVIFIVRICYCRYRKKDVYKFNYIFLFKVISLGVAFVIFYNTSSFDWNTIERLYIHFMDWEFGKMFLTIISSISFLDIILNLFSLICLFTKIGRAVKQNKNTFRNHFFEKFDSLGKSDDNVSERPNPQDGFAMPTCNSQNVSTETLPC